LSEYRSAVLKEEGGVLGVMGGTVTLDPEIADTNAARSLISAKLYDDEKLSGAFGSQYVWIPRYSDQRRTLIRGYRTRFASIFAPPESGSYRLQFFGYGQTRELAASSSAASIEAAVHEIAPALSGVDVTTDPLGMLIDLDFRIGIGCTAGQMVAQGGVGICLVSRDFSTALRKGTRWLLSPRIPFETEDEVLGLHECVNLALADIRETDLLPVASALPFHQRPKVVRLTDIAPWLEPEMVLGFFAPTDWVSVTGFRPPTSGTYQLQPHTARPWPLTPTPLPYNASGTDIKMALQALLGTSMIHVTPETVAPEYQIIWESMYHRALITSTAGYVVGYSSERLRDPYAAAIVPSHLADFESSTFGDPGYAEDQSWFISCQRPAYTRICPQTYPRKADGSLDTSREPIPGTVWVESTTGLINDFDQARPSIEKVAPAALRYACLALAAVAPAGEATRWEQMAARSATVAASRVVYGKQSRRSLGSPTIRSWPPLDGSRGIWNS
jgi:hypothetical protein